MTISWGWSGMSHDASLAVFENDKLVFAAHSERYSRIKNDKNLHQDLINEALEFGKPDEIYYYEDPFLKKTRQLYSGQYYLLNKQSPRTYMKKFGIDKKHITTTHHHSHAAAGYYTSRFWNAAIICIDSIGEWETFSIWSGKGTMLTKEFSQYYPHSVGIWYSAMTQRIGLKPQEHEYILMGMAAIGDADKYYDIVKEDFIKKMPSSSDPRILFKRNCHRGCLDWRPDLNTVQDIADIAAATQRIYEEIFEHILGYTKEKTGHKNLVIMGGCALNCVANTLALKYFKDVWIMPNPGDAGSSIGCILAHKQKHIQWPGAYLGHEIAGLYPDKEILSELKKNKITAVAFGKAEFGPRALGNRSILADPRGKDVKDRVNELKKREAFRPFAPMILEEEVHNYFEVEKGFKSPYMQFTVKCKYPDKFPAIVHFDNSSRVQTVNKTDHPTLYKLLKKWYDETGCPMLLNTSLNIRGEPLVNTKEDAKRWTKKYGFKICLPR